MRSRVQYSDYCTQLTDNGWMLATERSCERAFTRDGQTLVVTVCRNVHGDLFVTGTARPLGLAAD
jgi:hypothetical protein